MVSTVYGLSYLSLWNIDSLFPDLRTNLCEAAHWDDVLMQPRQRMESGTQRLVKFVVFVSKGPVEQSIGLEQCRVSNI